MRPSLDAASLERLALSYAGRYATSRARLRDYLRRKLRERGWAGEGPAAIEAIVARFADQGYVDDRALAAARGRALAAKGYGARRLSQAMGVLGIGEEDAAAARRHAEEVAWNTALRFAERRRLGPFASHRPDQPAHRKAFAAMIRAGHSPAVIKRILDAPPGIVPEQDDN